MQVFPRAIVYTTKPCIHAYVFFTSKWDLVVRTIALGKTCISAIRGGNQAMTHIMYKLVHIPDDPLLQIQLACIDKMQTG